MSIIRIVDRRTVLVIIGGILISTLLMTALVVIAYCMLNELTRIGG